MNFYKISARENFRWNFLQKFKKELVSYPIIR
ncbi:MAG: hypothetical protein RI957_488 [Verrucomicrobiota bacterium]|jgi:hypothetical protein